MTAHSIMAVPFLLLSSSLLLVLVHGGCPVQLKAPCNCVSSRYETVSIVCDKGQNLNHVLQSLVSAPGVIDSLTISNTPIEEIPAFAFSDLTVKSLILKNNGLSSMSSEAFEGPMINSLESLEIRSNLLDSIPQTGINEIRSLKSLSLYDNAISTVENNAFLSYHSRTIINKLDLSANNMSVIFAQGLLGLESLQQLFLDKNRLKVIPEEALVLVPTLEQLSLGINEIESIGVGALQLPQLKSLSLEVNKIRSIAPDALQTVPNLAYLYLAGNVFTTIESTMFFYVNRLKVLSMNNNHELRIVPSNAFQYIPNLVRLELADCSISVIEPGALHKVPKLQVINIARNHLTHISNDAFTALPSVVTVDLSGNIISSIDDFAFSQLASLATMDLSSNRLEVLHPNSFYHSLVPHNGRARILYLYTWMRKWLRENPDITVSKKNDQVARCWTPATASGQDLREESPAVETAAVAASTQSVQSVVPGDKMRKLIKTPPVTATSIIDPPVQIGTEDPKVSSMSLAALIIGVVFGILALVVIMMIIIRCIIKSRDDKATDSRYGEESIASSNGYTGSAYSTTGIFPDQCRPPTQLPRLGSPGSILMPPSAGLPYLHHPRIWS